jgi:hypothetical protein
MKPMPPFCCWVGLIACLATSSTLAQQSNQPATYSSWSWSGHIDHVNLDKDAAWAEGIEDSATAIGFAAERYTNTSEMTLSLGMNYLFYHDNAAFAQYVRDYWGYIDYEQSDATAITVFAEYGPKYRFGQNNLNFVVIRGGASAVLFSERAIYGCSNCYSEDIDIDGGLYGVLGVGQTLGSLDVSLQFQQYFSGDIDNSFRLKISGTF